MRTDPATLSGAAWLLENAGVRDKVTAGLPEPGGLYFFNPVPRRPLPADWAVRSPPPEGQSLVEYHREAGLIAQVLDKAGVLALLPWFVRTKLNPPPISALGMQLPPG